MISVFIWDESSHKYTKGGPELLPPPDRIPSVLWIDLDEPTLEEEKLIFETFFRVHALTLEDIQRPRRLPGEPPHFPKVEEFKDYLYVIVNPLSLVAADNLLGDDNSRCCGQLNAVLTHNLLITHHAESLVSVQDLHEFLTKNPTQASRGPDFLFHHVLDVMVDHYAPLMDHVDTALDELEEKVFTEPGSHLLAQLLRLKHRIIHLRKTLILEREVLSRLWRGEFALIDEREKVYYRNVYDHLLRFTELIEASREMISDLMQTLLAAQANKLNEIMKVLTMISVTLLPMTLISGVYGMNFKEDTAIWLPSLGWEYGMLFALALMAISGLGALWFFRWMKWI